MHGTRKTDRYSSVNRTAAVSNKKKGLEEIKKLLMLVAIVMFGLGILTSCGLSRSDIEDTAKDCVNDIIIENCGRNDTARCVRVKITEKIATNHYRGIAMLDNGHDLKIAIEVDDDIVNVTIPLDELFE